MPSYDGAAVVHKVLALALTLLTVPGPDSVVVVANADIADSVALAKRYAATRAVPDRQVCALSLPVGDTISVAEFQARLVTPLESCLADSLARIEAVLLVRGVPLRVAIADGATTRRVSLAAALGVYRSTVTGGGALLGEAPGNAADCGGTPCYAARWRNPFTTGVFRPGWTRSSGGVDWRPLLVTMLHGRTYADAARLVASATTAEASPPRGRFVFMNGGDAPRSRLDSTYDAVIAALGDRGFTDVARVPYGRNLTGETFASFIVGTSALEDTIEGNDFAAGALVDNLTSFGAVPVNFEPTGESQVSIARWVAKGVAGVHGTTDEPLSSAFPDRQFLVDWVDGMTLAEAYLRRMPFVYWQNLVLGDPMAAPFARRPVVHLDAPDDSAVVVGAVRLAVSATDSEGRGIASLRLFVDGVEVASTPGGPIDDCFVLRQGDDVQILAVAQVFGLGDSLDGYSPKGWATRRVRVRPGPTDCTAKSPDGGVAIDAATAPPPPPPPPAPVVHPQPVASCRCGVSTASIWSWWLVLPLLLNRRRRSAD